MMGGLACESSIVSYNVCILDGICAVLMPPLDTRFVLLKEDTPGI
jgi:hypothetical protein